MKRTKVFLVIALGLAIGEAGADEAKASDSRQKDSDGFSRQIDNPRGPGLPTYLIELKDGELLPPELVVPAKTRFQLLVRNIGSKPAEFESNQLRQEKILFMGSDVTVTITPLDAGAYDYFDDFAVSVPGKIIAKARE
jgi:hypothetical protein